MGEDCGRVLPACLIIGPVGFSFPSEREERRQERIFFFSPLNMLFVLSSGAAKQVVYTNCPGLLCLFSFLSGPRRRLPGPVFHPGDRPFSPFRRAVFPPIFPGFALLVILLTKRRTISFFEDFKKQSFLVHLSLIFLFLHEKALPPLHHLFKFPFLHRSLMFWRAAVVVAVLLFSPSSFPFF